MGFELLLTRPGTHSLTQKRLTMEILQPNLIVFGRCLIGGVLLQGFARLGNRSTYVSDMSRFRMEKVIIGA